MSVENPKTEPEVDVDALHQARRLADELLDRLETRTERAENRAKPLLGICAAGATLLAAYGATSASSVASTGLTFQRFILLGLGILLLKAAWYCLGTLRPSKGYEVTADLIAETQSRDICSALANEIKWKSWVFVNNEQLVVRKFYAYDRAQRNFILFVLGLAAAVVFVTLRPLLNPVPSAWLLKLRYGLGSVMILLALVADRLVEPLGIWHRRNARE